jgi:hypothetical protein
MVGAGEKAVGSATIVRSVVGTSVYDMSGASVRTVGSRSHF